MKNGQAKTLVNRNFQIIFWAISVALTFLVTLMFAAHTVKAETTIADPNGAPLNISQSLMIDSKSPAGTRPTISTNIQGVQYFDGADQARSLTNHKMSDMNWWGSDMQGYIFPRTAVNSNSTITTDYPYVGTYRGRKIGAHIVISHLLTDMKYDLKNQQRSRLAVFAIFDNWYHGYDRLNINQEEDSIKFYYQDNHQTVSFPEDSSSDAFMSFNSLNGWFISKGFDPQPKGSVGDYVGQVDGLDHAFITNDNILLHTPDPFGTLPGEHDVYGGKNYDFDDHLGSSTYTRASAMFQLSGTEQKFVMGTATSEGKNYYGADDGNPNYMGFSSAPIGNVAPSKPKKTISDDQNNPINGQTIYAGQTLNYDISQKVNTLGVDILTAYKSFEISDNLEPNLSYQKAELIDDHGNHFDVNQVGTLTYHDNQVDFKANTNFLQNVMKYDGRTYTLRLTVKLSNTTPSGNTVTNIATSAINNYKQATSPVDNKTSMANVVTNYISNETGQSLAPSVTVNYPYTANYTTNEAKILGYHLISQPTNASGTVTQALTTVNYCYARDQEQVRANYSADHNDSKQESGQTLAPSETTTGLYNDTYNTFSKQIMGWHLLTTPNNATGKLTVNTPDVNYLYDRDTEVVTTHYVDTKGHKLANDQTYLGLYGLSYSTQPMNIGNYHLSKMPDNASGTYGNSSTDVTYVYDNNPAIKEGLSRDSATFTNYENIVNTSEAKLQYSNTYHYVTKATVGGSMTLDRLSLYSTLSPAVSPLIKGGDINNQNIKVYRVDDNQLTDITADGKLTYTTGDSANDTAVKTSSDPNTLYSMNRTRRVYWTAKDPQSLVGQKLVMDVPAVIWPDRDKLMEDYSSSSGIRVNDLAAINESNDISESGPVRDMTTSNKSLTSQQTVADMPNIYTVKAYKSMFNTGDKIKGTIYFKLYRDLVTEKPDDGNAALTVSLLGNSQNVNIPMTAWYHTTDVFKVNVDTNTLADNHPFNFSWSSNRTSQSSGCVVLTKSLIKSESSTDGVEKTDYRDDGDLYSASNTAVQNKPSQTTGTDGSGVEGVETYYRQKTEGFDNDHSDLSQHAIEKEMTPLYVKLMEYMHANYQPTVSAKSGYGIKNDVALNYYGRHLNTNSETDFLKNDSATTFSTADDLTTAKGKSSSQIKNNQSELLGQTANEMSDNQLRAGLASAHDAAAYLSTRFSSSQVPSLLKHQTKSPYMWDQAGDDVNNTDYFGHLSSSDQSFIDTADTATQSAPTEPILYQMAYQFNKRLLSSGIEYVDPKDTQAASSQLQNVTPPPADAHNGGHLFYTNQWLPLGNYDTTYQSHAFGSNDFIFKLSRKLNIYGHRYLAKGAGPDSDTYDDLAIQPVITGDSNKSNTTFASNDWTNK